MVKVYQLTEKGRSLFVTMLIAFTGIAVNPLTFAQSTTAPASTDNYTLRGETVFEELLQQNGGKLPEKFTTRDMKNMSDNLLGMLSRLYRPNRASERTFDLMFTEQAVPDSRSAQRLKSNKKFPRQLFISDDGAGSVLRKIKPIFIGHAPLGKQVEVISWNPQARPQRYEFLLVENFGPGLKPELKTADRNFCLSCHQHGGPIFSRAPWSEMSTLATPRTDTEAYTEEEKKLFVFSYNDLNSPTRFSRSGGGAFSFDIPVRTAAKHLQAANICEHLCSTDRSCKELLLRLAFMYPGSEKTSAIPESVRAPLLRLAKKNWPEHGFAYPSSVLPDRNPLKDEDQQGISTVFRVVDEELALQSRLEQIPPRAPQDDDLIRRKMRHNAQGINITYDEDLTLRLGELPTDGVVEISFRGLKSGSPADPLAPRPLTVPLIPEDLFSTEFLRHLGPACFGLDDAGRLNEVSWTRRTLAATEMTTAGLFDDNKEATSDEIMDRFLLGLKKSYEDDAHFLKCVDPESIVSPLSPETEKRLRSLTSTFQTDADKLKLFSNCCLECHGADSSRPLPLTDDTKLRAYRDFEDHSIVDRLEGKGSKMPPAKAHMQPSEEERKIMIEFLKTEKK